MLTKLVTAAILMGVKAIPVEQKAIRGKRRGCIDALWTDYVVAGEATAERQSMAVAWVDYSKAFDQLEGKEGDAVTRYGRTTWWQAKQRQKDRVWQWRWWTTQKPLTN